MALQVCARSSAERQSALPPHQTLHCIVCGLMRYVRNLHPEWNFLKDPQFADFQRTLDSEMKHLRSLALGVKKKQAEPITSKEENILWERGLLGATTPQVLLDTMVFLCGMYFALRSGQEHRELDINQIELFEPPDGPSFLRYTENYSKNNRGGLSMLKVEPKQVTHHQNIAKPERCLVHLYKEYLRHCLPERKSSAFYLTPLKKNKSDVWFSRSPVGHNTWSKTVKCLCSAGGITGFKTNHSLCVSSATRLFQGGVDEQLIMKRTGHRSIDGVRTYKRVSDAQHCEVSDVLNSATSNSNKRPKLETDRESESENTGVSSPLGRVSSPLGLHFTNCSGITINYVAK